MKNLKLAILIIFAALSLFLPCPAHAQNECPSGTWAAPSGMYTDINGVSHQNLCFYQDGRLYLPSTINGVIGIKVAACATLQADLNNACNGTTPGKILVPACTLSSGITINDNCDVGGYGKDQSIFTTSGTTGFDVISNANQVNGKNISIHDLQINANSFTGGTGRSIYLKNITGYSIDRVKILNSRTFALFVDQGSGQGWVTNNWCDTVNNGSCFLIGNGPVNGISTDVTIANNYTAKSQTANGIFVTGSSQTGQTGSCRITITGNRSYHNKDTQIEIGDSSCNTSVTGNVVNLDATGETGILARSTQNVSITGNVVSADTAASTQTGIFVWNNTVDNIPFSNITVAGNTVQGLSGTTSSGIAWSSDSSSSDGLTIVGNNSIGNTINYNPKTTNITHLSLFNTDGLWQNNGTDLSLQSQSSGNIHMITSKVGISSATFTPVSVFHIQTGSGANDLTIEQTANNNAGSVVKNTNQSYSYGVRAASSNCTAESFMIRDVTGTTDVACIDASTGTLNVTGFVRSANTQRLTSDTTLAANTSLQTFLSWSLPAVARNYNFHCGIMYVQATAVVADAFGIQSTVTPTNLVASGEVYTAAGTSTSGTSGNVTNTTASNVLTFTPSGPGTILMAEINGQIETTSSATTLNIMASQSNSADLITIKRGSYCQLF